MKIALLMFTLNEEEGIKKVLEKKPKCFNELIVVDGHSTDKTVEIAYQYGCKIIQQEGKGKGNAFKTFLKTKLKSDFYVMIDADDSYDIREVGNIIMPYDVHQELFNEIVVLGFRDKIHLGAMSASHEFANSFFTLLARIFYKVRLYDLCSGYWGFSRTFLESIDIQANGFDLEADLFINCYRKMKNKNFLFDQAPVSLRKRKGKAKIRWKDGLIIFKRLMTNIDSRKR